MKRIFIVVVTSSLLIFAVLHARQVLEPTAKLDNPAGDTAQARPGTNGSPSARQAAISSTTAATRPELSQEALLSEARAMNRVFPDKQTAEAEEKKLEALAASLTDSDREYLVEKVNDANQGDNVRAYSLYLLSLAPSTTPANFKAIALMPNPVAGKPVPEHSPEEWQDRTVKAFATGAVWELKKRLPQDPGILRDLQEISEQASMPIVKKLARTYLREADSREPASLKRGKK